MKIRCDIAQEQISIRRCHLLLVLLLLIEGIAIYHIAFIGWRGPGDFGSNKNYVPAVMIGVGRGFSDVEEETLESAPALKAFVNFETMSLDTNALPKDMPVVEANEAHKIYRYMLYTVGFFWRLFGVSWNVVRILCVVVLFLCAFLVYHLLFLIVFLKQELEFF